MEADIAGSSTRRQKRNAPRLATKAISNCAQATTTGELVQ